MSFGAKFLLQDQSQNTDGRELTLLMDVMSRTTFTRNKLSVSSAALNCLCYSMSKRAGESSETSASAKQYPVHCSGLIARNYCNKNADMDLSHTTSTRRSSRRRLHAWKFVSARFRKRQQDYVRSLKLWKTGGLRSIQALRDPLLQKILQVKRKLLSSKYWWKNTYGRRSWT